MGDERRAFAPPCTCCRIGVSTSRKPRAAKRIAQRLHHRAAGREQSARVRVDREVDVAAAGPGSPDRTGPSTCPAAGAGTCRHPPVRRQHRQLAAAAASEVAGDLDEVAEVEVGGELRRAARRRRLVRSSSTWMSPDQSAATANATPPWSRIRISRPGRSATGVPVGRRGGRRDRVRRRVRDRVRIDASGGEPVELVHPDPHLLGRLRSGGAGRARLARPVRCRRRAATRPPSGCQDRVRAAGVACDGVSASGRAAADEALGAPADAHADLRQRRGRRRSTGSRGAHSRLVLHVRPVQRLQLPPPREEHAGSQRQQPQHRPGADPRALLEDRPEHREVQRDPVHPELAAGVASSVTMNSIDPFGATSDRAASGRARRPGRTPRHERQQPARRAPSASRDGLDQHAVAVGRIAEPPERHREPALGLGVAPRRRRAGRYSRHLLGGMSRCRTDPDGDALPAGPG